MSILSVISQLEIPQSLELVKQEREVKHCQGCQILAVDKKYIASRITKQDFMFTLKLLETRLDIKDKNYGYCNDESNSIDKVGVWVEHIPNRPDCYNYRLKKVAEVFMYSTREPSSSQSEVFFEGCPGHKEFIGRYDIERKARRKGGGQVSIKLLDPNIVSANYTLIQKNRATKIQKEKYFNVLFANRHAVILNYKHHDASSACPFHPFYSASVTKPLPHEEINIEIPLNKG